MLGAYHEGGRDFGRCTRRLRLRVLLPVCMGAEEVFMTDNWEIVVIGRLERVGTHGAARGGWTLDEGYRGC